MGNEFKFELTIMFCDGLPIAGFLLHTSCQRAFLPSRRKSSGLEYDSNTLLFLLTP